MSSQIAFSICPHSLLSQSVCRGLWQNFISTSVRDHVEKTPRTRWAGLGEAADSCPPVLPSVHGLRGGPAVNAGSGLQHPDPGHQVRGAEQGGGGREPDAWCQWRLAFGGGVKGPEGK